MKNRKTNYKEGFDAIAKKYINQLWYGEEDFDFIFDNETDQKAFITTAYELKKIGCNSFSEMLKKAFEANKMSWKGKKKLTYESLAEYCGIDKNTVANALNGKQIKLENVVRLCLGLSVPYERSIEMVHAAGYTLRQNVYIEYIFDFELKKMYKEDMKVIEVFLSKTSYLMCS